MINVKQVVNVKQYTELPLLVNKIAMYCERAVYAEEVSVEDGIETDGVHCPLYERKYA